MDASGIRRTMNDLQTASNELRTTVRSVSHLWNDEKYMELTRSVATLGQGLQNALEAGQNACNAAAAFSAIAAERY